jgi:hypothetical protein
VPPPGFFNGLVELAPSLSEPLNVREQIAGLPRYVDDLGNQFPKKAQLRSDYREVRPHRLVVCDTREHAGADREL